MKKKSYEILARPTPEEFAEAEKLPVTVVLDGIRSLNNVGSVFRTCDGFAVEKLCLCGITATPPDREIHKTALGAEDTVRWEYYTATTDAVVQLRAKGFTVIAVEQAQGSVMLNEFGIDPDRRYALVLGNEVFGVSDECLALCDGAVEIPQAGTKHSLNISVAAGVVLWHFFQSLYLRR
ncbi:MAG: RNA methyltransferase [Alistipes sp.]|nr:RNA methyltransferase [Alistipes sp.]